MIKTFERFKIPTLAGLGIILAGIVAGVVLILSEQTFLTEASPNFTPKNITVSNIDDASATISWQTGAATYSVVSYWLIPLQQMEGVDERDTQTSSTFTSHSVKLKNLQPKTTYQFKVISGKIKSDTLTFQTAALSTSQDNFGPIIGSVLDNDKFLTDGVVYLTIPGGVTQSAVINNLGNFLIPLNSIYKTDLSDILPLSGETIAKLTVISQDKQTQVSFKLSPEGVNLPPLKLAQKLDLTVPPLQQTEATLSAEATSSAQPSNQDLSIFDLNGDNSINATDNAIVLKNFGKNPQNKKADLNFDGVVDQKDLTLMSEKINQSTKK
ncbi:hypothetical protein A3B45_02330 [Candidatus Daviesbacteria bacterium RIFCSPLOWO2_01_FULL_39_12]|uniref:Fibronectin type-III domain-containing protein n=1 Tax=Candidatus Daviesbacteria bacterium RIFCSPLOWO2_01_FULL_39_12 TaxID=1797785 RepID=A0A1F5KSN8_9BACT|nr:MAG: hypothetical protein A3D79_00740 [Candidatus Daviesbacteria bacterium RIFCSPHIGHO2_02_FULL_39_8]OGE43844.1 MAG: hypothetical protein A3B45_02330 [Candidatus Daviesbacteria bacterium RIFCSPLOWO2_01_FULL_39_12]